MRPNALALSVLLLSITALPVTAQFNPSWRISVLATEMSGSERAAWSDGLHPGVGLGLAYAPTPLWDVELTVASQTHTSPYTRIFYATSTPGTPGLVYPVTEFHEYRVTPVDLSATRHLLPDQPISPYVRAGVRYVKAPADPYGSTLEMYPVPMTDYVPLPVTGDGPIPVTGGFGFSDRVSAQAAAGMRVRLTERMALRAEATRLLRSDEAEFDPLMHYAVGLSWLF